MRSLHGKNIELETQLQLESRAKRWALTNPSLHTTCIIEHACVPCVSN